MNKSRFEDRIVAALTWGTFFLVLSVFAVILGDLLGHGVRLFTWDFLWTEPSHSGRQGGIAPILVSTFLILAICLAAALPLAVGTAILLAEYNFHERRFGRFVRLSLDILSGVPSIVFGLFGNALFSQFLGLGFSILAGGLTLACMVLPMLIRSFEEGLRSAPREYRLAGAALGLSRLSILSYLLIPAAAPGLLVGIVLSVGRALAESAALIFTSGYVDRMPSSIMDSGRVLSLHIFDLSMNISGGDDGAYRSVLVLVVILLIINGGARALSAKWLNRRIMTA